MQSMWINFPSRLGQRTARWHQISLLLLLTLSVWLRVHQFLQIEHNVDHAYYIGQALRILATGVPEFVGQDTSLQFPNAALLAYVYMPFVALLQSPVAAYIPVIGLNILAVLLCYRAVGDLLTPRAGLIAAAFMAVNPWVIEYSRNTWTHALLPFLLCAMAWQLWPLLREKSGHPGRALLIVALLATAITQSSLLGYFVLPGLGLLGLRFWKRLPYASLALGLLIFLAFNALFAYGLFTRGELLRSQTDAMFSGASGAYLRSEPLQHALRLVTGAEYEINRGLAAPIQDSALRHDLSRVASGILSLGLLAGAGLALLRLRHDERAQILLISFFTPVLAMSYNASLVHPFYLLLTLPAGYALLAWALDALLDRLPRGAVILALCLYLPFALLMAINSSRYYEETALIPGAHGLTALSLEYGLPLGDAIRSHLPPGGTVISPVEGWIMTSFAGQHFPTLREQLNADLTVYPAAGALFVRSHLAESPVSALPLTERVETLIAPDGLYITLDRYAPGTLPAAQARIAGERWLSLLDARVQPDGAGLSLELIFQVDAITPELAGYAFSSFVHVYDAQGERVAIVDGAAVDSALWQAGDLHRHLLHLDLSEEGGPFSLHIGLYDGQRQTGLTFILPDGDYVQAVPLPGEWPQE